MKVITQQVDLDTCLTALVMGVSTGDRIVVVRGRADEVDLADSQTLCIEAGGAGRVTERNFDHHDPGGPTEPACLQALKASGQANPALVALVDYVAAHDLGTSDHTLGARRDDVLNLAALFSGMRLGVADPAAQLLAGLSILRAIVDERIDPAGPMPDRPEWRAYARAKRAMWRALDTVRERAEIFTTARGTRAGFLETDAVGAIGELYATDCEIAIAYSPRFLAAQGLPEIAKHTIGGRDGCRVDGLLALLNALEPGWGGPSHGTIVASPRAGSQLAPDRVKEVVREEL